MTTKECFSLNDISYSGKGIRGWIDLEDGWQPYLTTTKRNIHDDILRAKLMEILFHRIRPLLELTERLQDQIQLDNIALQIEAGFNNLLAAEKRAATEIVRADRDHDPTPRQTRGNGSGNGAPSATKGRARKAKCR